METEKVQIGAKTHFVRLNLQRLIPLRVEGAILGYTMLDFRLVAELREDDATWGAVIEKYEVYAAGGSKKEAVENLIESFKLMIDYHLENETLTSFCENQGIEIKQADAFSTIELPLRDQQRVEEEVYRMLPSPGVASSTMCYT